MAVQIRTRGISILAALLGVVAALGPALHSPTKARAAISSFSSEGIGSMGTPRWVAAAAPLPDGRVLVAGGRDSSEYLSSAEIFDPATDSFSSEGIGSVGTPRWDAVAAPLSDGRVLVAGGYNEGELSSAEVFDPGTGSFSSEGIGSMGVPRWSAVAAPLPDGRVLVAGGYNESDEYLSSAEVFDPGTGSFSSEGIGSMGTPRFDAVAAPLPDGRVLVAGGYNESDEYLASAEVFDPATGSFSSEGVGSMGTAREGAVAAPLPDGRVLVAGGYNESDEYLSSAEVFDPATGSFSSEGIGSMGTPRWDAVAAPLPDGRVLVAGGSNGSVLASAEVFVPAAAKATPSIVTAATASVTVGQQIGDEATISGGSSPGGTITFRAYGPNDPTCANAPAYTSSALAVSGNGNYANSPAFTPSAAGSYRWTASYSGDANNEAVATACNDANETSTVNASTPPPTVNASTPPPTVSASMPPPPSNRFSFSLKGTKLKVRVKARGKVKVAKASKLLKASRASGGPPKITVALKLTKHAKKLLKKKGKLKLKTRITFTPLGGTARTKTAKLTIKHK